MHPWYTNAVIYGIDIERFADGNGDGIGDFIGARQKIGYLRDLGITCVWLLPFFGSPGRDNGYDVTDYYAIDPRVGTRQDFLDFVHAAGEHGIRVIIDLVVNHTSNEHPWFEASRRDAGSRFRDFYVWSKEPPPVEPGNRSIFPGEETGVWTHDEVAGAYYFHKFYHFQPDLNIANEEVRAEIERIIDYWLALGVSGFRIDAAPLVIGDNGLERTNPEDPHGVLREMRKFMDARREEGALLGEVNMPVEELSPYFGQGDQLGLLLNFMFACYAFAAMARESAQPLYDLHHVMPVPPPNCGWSNFLRNLDELDFSRVPEDLRESVFETFAPKPDMQVYDRGVRRRLAPMLGGDPRRIKLAFSLMMSQRGSPLFVYGDEIGLGEELDKVGRDAVRIPMQWTGGRNAGFSDAPAKDLVLPPLATGPFSYRKVNVEAQEGQPDSILEAVKKMTFVRRGEPLFERGRWHCLPASHDSVFAQTYVDADRQLVILENLSGHEVSVEVESGGDNAFKDLLSEERTESRDKTIKVRLPPYGYRWFATES